MSEQAISPLPTRPPFWRDVRILAILGQVAFVLIIAVVAGMLYANVTSGMQRLGIVGGFDFMNQTAGFDIGVRPIPYSPSDTYWRAFRVGVINTLLVSILGIVLATLLGLLIGIAQLSSNWLVARLAQSYVVIFRHVPVLVQLFFWYQAVFLRLPRIQNAIELPGPIYLSNKGLIMVGLTATPSTSWWFGFIFIGVLGAVMIWYWLKRRQERTGQQAPRFLISLLVVATTTIIGWLVLATPPLELSIPERRGLNYRGGFELTPEYAALLVGW